MVIITYFSDFNHQKTSEKIEHCKSNFTIIDSFVLFVRENVSHQHFCYVGVTEAPAHSTPFQPVLGLPRYVPRVAWLAHPQMKDVGFPGPLETRGSEWLSNMDIKTNMLPAIL